ncbi:hypothetical protein Cgig2_009526 [Carnegiea gigantea]|uniref:Uncharacterized protein n=1 Tax=Carnegiea gigantea TaxID=171969 RepID=A0A9Q1KAJ1_9CARY|nr:hypothetical protein Cgig2_009526 [Carnegiea gigantea]
MANGQWLAKLPNSKVIFHPDDTSDHYPGVLRFFEMQEQGRKTFRFFDMWTTDPQFLQIVSETWNIPVQGTPMFTISKKLELLQLPLRKLNKEVFRDVQVKYAAARNALNDIMVHIQQQPQNENLYKEEKAAIENVQTRKQRLESFYEQKSKDEWLNLDDTNGQYFHAKLKQRHHLNRIASYQMQDGQQTWSYDKHDIGGKSLKHVQGWLKDTPRTTGGTLPMENIQYLQGTNG